MIPPDIAIRLRFLYEDAANAQPVAGLQRSREIQSQLQDLMPGQRFFATLVRTLPDGTFRAVVAGNQITLSLNASAKPGDTLELVAKTVTPKVVTAQLADTTTTAALQTGSARATLSPTGQLISFLLTGQPAPKPAQLAASQPLLNTPPAASSNAAAQLAPLLRQSLAQSGLFYEAHQAQWLNGKVNLAALLREPQATLGGQSQPAAQTAANANPATTTPSQPGATTGATTTGSPATQTAAAQSTAANTGLAAAMRGGMVTAAAAISARAAQAPEEAGQVRANLTSAAAQSAEQAATRGAPQISERLLSIVHQQLDAFATQQYAWHGIAWPGQPFEWIIEDPHGEGEEDGEASGDEWETTLKLTLPRLGGIEARLHLSAVGVALRLKTADASAAARLEAGRDDLTEALAAANVPLTGMVVEPDHGPE
ncbi:hypothetical protein AGMMS49960_20760 [Betaproteobacteria bacterium]|nr:hypothetical protein AGMMS49543_14210 [Betaproteobacteria bacterium]GHU04723.1 hypothetical protein AGMMS49960_20760 [Betaproteobacteria bacterium]GHU20858.1 hypothetical protein AGMMS50243_16970 [Betaproteobacteria bacterium]